QRVDFRCDLVKVAPSIPVPKIDLGTDTAIIGTAPRSLDFSARAVRRGIEAVMMMAMAPDPCIRPVERRQVGESRGERGAVHDEIPILVPGQSRHLASAPVMGKIVHRYLALTPYLDITAKFGERR